MLKLRYLIEHRRGLGLLVGATGVGKTRLLDALVQPYQQASIPVVTVHYPMMTSVELLTYVGNKLAGDAVESRATHVDVALARLEYWLRKMASQNRFPIIVIDDAQAITDKSVLQSLQLLMNYQHTDGMEFTLILAGQPELVASVKRLPQLEDRVSMTCVLQPMSLAETKAYIGHRLHAVGGTRQIFSDAAMTVIHELSGGLPRRINRLCDYSLLVGYAEELSEIDSDHVENVHAELMLSRAA